MSLSTSVCLEDVTVRVGDKNIIEGVNLKITQGERVSVLGPSGAGKTTVLRVLAGLENRIVKGRVELAGKNAFCGGKTKMLPHERQASMLFQDLALWPHLTAQQHLLFPLRKMKIKKKLQTRKIDEMLEAMGIAGRNGSKPAELSGGEQQRLALGRAIIAGPSILLLDEPFSSLDLPLKRDMMELVLSSHERFQFTLIHVTHDPSEAVLLAKRVVLMDSGRIVWTGSFEKLVESKNPTSVALFDSLEWLSKEVSSKIGQRGN